MIDVFKETQELTIARGLKEGEDYVIVKDGLQAEHKYVNLGNPKYCKREGIVEIIPLKFNKLTSGAPRHENKKLCKSYRDKKTGLIWGIPIDINPDTKQIIHQAVIADDRMIFDLSIADSAKTFAILKNGPFMEGSPNLVGKPSYKIVDKEVNAAVSIDRRSQRRKAEDIINTLKGEGLFEMARNLGINVEANRSLPMLTDELFRVMEIDPKKFLEIYNNPNREFISIFHKALEKGIIKLDLQVGTYNYQGLTLGNTKDMAVKYLVDNTGISTTINMLCEQMDNDTKRSMEPIFEPKQVPNESDEIERLKKELAELKSSVKKQDVLPEEPVSFKDPFDVKDIKVEKEEDKELSALKARAKELDIKGYGLPTMTKEKLALKIEEAENKDK